MKVRLTCHRCGADVEAELFPIPPEQTGGRKGFYEYETECPSCGEELEGVLKEEKPEGAK